MRAALAPGPAHSPQTPVTVLSAERRGYQIVNVRWKVQPEPVASVIVIK